MQLALYVHPFDLAALAEIGGLSRLADLGFNELAMATSYHDGRWLTPWHPERRVRFLEDGTVHFRPGIDYGELRPLPSSEVPESGASPLESLCAEAAGNGLAVRAWNVFGHNTRLGTRYPDTTVENAFGDRYPYALCPANAAVQHYHTTMVRDLAAHDGLQTIELEALGQMGIQHSSHHDKKSIAPKGLVAFALSQCFCSACRSIYRDLGHDPSELRAAVRGFLTAQLTDACAMEPPPVVTADDLDPAQRVWVEAAIAVRAESVRKLAEAVIAASGTCRRAVQVHPDPWFTGSQLAAGAAAAFPAGDERVLTCYGDGPDGIERLLGHAGASAFADSPKRVSVWPKAPEFGGDEDLERLRELGEQHGVGSLAIYHLGLLPPRTLERAARVLAG